MASLIDLFIILPFIALLIYFQVKIIKYSLDKNAKFYCRILLGLYIIIVFTFFLNVDYKFPAGFAIWLGMGIILGYFGLYNLINIKFLHRQQEINEIDKEFQELRANTHEYIRKFFHFFFFGGVLLEVFIFNTITITLLENIPGFAEFCKINPFWPGFDYIITPKYISPTLVDISVMVFFMIGIPFAIILEFFRLSPNMGIPFYRLFIKSLRPSEQHNVGHYYYFIFGIFMASIFLPIACTFGILCLLCFGDTFASIIGKKIGKHKIKWESEKSWEGTIGGSIITFITSYFFVGWELAIILTLIFGIFDIFTPNLLKISDNLLYPLLAGIILYLIVVIFGYQIQAPVADIFGQFNEWYAMFYPEWA